MKTILWKPFRIIVDEANTVEQRGHNFRPELYTAVKQVGHLVRKNKQPIQLMLMLATFIKVDCDRCTSLLNVARPNIMWGSLARRTTRFQCFITGSTASSLKNGHKLISISIQKDDICGTPIMQQMQRKDSWTLQTTFLTSIISQMVDLELSPTPSP